VAEGERRALRDASHHLPCVRLCKKGEPLSGVSDATRASLRANEPPHLSYLSRECRSPCVRLVGRVSLPVSPISLGGVTCRACPRRRLTLPLYIRGSMVG
jgi:hypothetical protein